MSKKRVYLSLLVGLLLTGLSVFGLYQLDQHLHRKFDKISTLNQAGYRGPLVGPKLPGEKRIFLMGGSDALGYGVYADQTIAADLEQTLNASTESGIRFSVVNLGFNNAGVAAVVSDLKYYSFLKPDVVILYSGYGDIEPNRFLGRHESVVFRLTGYYPVFPLVISEKAKLIRYHSWGRWSQYKTVFRAGEKTQANQRDLSQARSGQLDWSDYCREMKTAIELALSENARILVVTEPYISAQHIEQQRALREMLQKEFGVERNVTYLDLGFALNPKEQEFATDGMHLSAAGNQIIAGKLAPVISNSIR